MEADDLKPETSDKSADGAGAQPKQSLAQMFALVVGVLMIAIGVGAMIVNPDFSTGSNLVTENLLFLDVNGWSGVLYLVIGFALLVDGRRAKRAKMAAIAVGAYFLLLTLYSLVDSSILGVVPVNDMTAILYAALGVIGLTVGLGPDQSGSSS